MKRHLIAAALSTAAALSLLAAPPAAPKDVVAVVNGEQITRQRIDQLWSGLTDFARSEYQKNGGKEAFVSAYVRKRALLQDAARKGFSAEAAKANLDPATESALFSRYVREHIAPKVVTEEQLLTFYEQNKSDFTHGDQVRARHVFVSTMENRSVTEAKEKIAKVMADLHEVRVRLGARPDAREKFLEAFSAAAKAANEDGSRDNGGALGWKDRSRLDPKFAAVAFELPLHRMSGIVESKNGFHLILVEDRREAGVETYDAARKDILEFLLQKNMGKIIRTADALANELAAKGKVAIYKENIK